MIPNLSAPKDCTEELNAFVARLPEQDHEIGVRFAGQLAMLSEYMLRVETALELLDETERLQNSALIGIDSVTRQTFHAKLDRRREMAARDVVLSIYQYGETFLAILDAQRNCPSLRVSESQLLTLRKLWKLFVKEFPGYEDMRHAIAHQAERMFDKEMCEKHWKDGELYFGKLQGRSYVVTNNRKHHTLPITWETLKKLVSFNRTIYSAFPNIFAWYAPFS